MARYLSVIRGTIRQLLSDEFVAGTTLDWKDDELDLHIGECIAEISDYAPYKVKETLATTDGSRELDISSIEDLVSIEKLEYKTDSYPRNYRNFNWIDSETIEIDISGTPGDAEDVYAYCNKLHSLTESSSTLNPQLERILILGGCGQAAISKSQSKINKVNVGGGRTPADMQSWGVSKLALYKGELRRIAEVKTYTDYPKG